MKWPPCGCITSCWISCAIARISWKNTPDVLLLRKNCTWERSTRCHENLERWQRSLRIDVGDAGDRE